jgi:hypothetical protein
MARRRRHGDHLVSVAEHSLVVETLYARLSPAAGPRWRLAALLHDAPEYVIGDMISPVKGAVGPDYAAMDARLAAAVHLRFGLPASLPAEVKAAIKRADRISAWLDRGLRGRRGEPAVRGAEVGGGGRDGAAAAAAGGGQARLPRPARGAAEALLRGDGARRAHSAHLG